MEDELQVSYVGSLLNIYDTQEYNDFFNIRIPSLISEGRHFLSTHNITVNNLKISNNWQIDVIISASGHAFQTPNYFLKKYIVDLKELAAELNALTDVTSTFENNVLKITNTSTTNLLRFQGAFNDYFIGVGSQTPDTPGIPDLDVGETVNIDAANSTLFSEQIISIHLGAIGNSTSLSGRGDHIAVITTNCLSTFNDTASQASERKHKFFDVTNNFMKIYLYNLSTKKILTRDNINPGCTIAIGLLFTRIPDVLPPDKELGPEIDPVAELIEFEHNDLNLFVPS